MRREPRKQGAGQSERYEVGTDLARPAVYCRDPFLRWQRTFWMIVVLCLLCGGLVELGAFAFGLAGRERSEPWFAGVTAANALVAGGTTASAALFLVLTVRKRRAVFAMLYNLFVFVLVLWLMLAASLLFLVHKMGSLESAVCWMLALWIAGVGTTIWHVRSRVMPRVVGRWRKTREIDFQRGLFRTDVPAEYGGRLYSGSLVLLLSFAMAGSVLVKVLGRETAAWVAVPGSVLVGCLIFWHMQVGLSTLILIMRWEKETGRKMLIAVSENHEHGNPGTSDY